MLKQLFTLVSMNSIDIYLAYPPLFTSISVNNCYILTYTRNTYTQQPLTHPSSISLENPSNIDNFAKLSKRLILLTITGRGYAI